MTIASYRGMDRAALDTAYNNVRADLDYQARLADFKARSNALYRDAAVRRDIAYGTQPRQRFDWMSCGRAEAPTFVFIHGGYWQNYAKDDLAFVAAGPLASGFNVALVEYTLAPEASMTGIVGEIRLLLDFLSDGKGDIGFRAKPVCLCGHSAGGQLAALHREHPAVTRTLSISGLFELEPIALSWLNEKLRLSPAEVESFSPMYKIGAGASAIVAVGDAELPELKRQSRDYADALGLHAQEAMFLSLAGHSHFSILDDLSDPRGTIMSAVTGQFAPDLGLSTAVPLHV
ncbi:alpha/beta hydrolase [Glacieibacterium megasporae]|uniref:alpha/beta hydrolase n=1 Tax=Glacieibacterium megasporae TaxID=2835787 RepID=UPI001C1E5564|nr:alpha/beta hydrolase [Polymorphobacter megasporae]UAJ10033.1 alpha/beta hydrolase fold domain-containing protein [Polymorphobacter megasporae]